MEYRFDYSRDNRIKKKVQEKGVSTTTTNDESLNVEPNQPQWDSVDVEIHDYGSTKMEREAVTIEGTPVASPNRVLNENSK